MTAARARRRLMAFERYRRRALLLGARPHLGVGSSEPHVRLFGRVAAAAGDPWRPWVPRDPHVRRPP
ncbi:hypothetical protein ABZS66_19095 [Dactylosporangium sp. NPDC005572]|uniref:hypothetical protein n=1 Tax=Dactylosporangium sp. NPDC005572 TaxID=3156889 RepID=UPI0033BB4141